ncbi:MAG: single-stranded DNA-binding protein [Bacteroidales bacterium]
MNLNKVLLIGRLGADPEHKKFDNGGRITTVNIAVNDPYWDKEENEWKSNTSWARCVFQNEIADRAMNLKKGDEILVEGKYKSRSYTDKNDNKQFVVEIKGTFKKGRPGKESRGEQTENTSESSGSDNSENQSASIPDADTGDLPF